MYPGQVCGCTSKRFLFFSSPRAITNPICPAVCWQTKCTIPVRRPDGTATHAGEAQWKPQNDLPKRHGMVRLKERCGFVSRKRANVFSRQPDSKNWCVQLICDDEPHVFRVSSFETKNCHHLQAKNPNKKPCFLLNESNFGQKLISGWETCYIFHLVFVQNWEAYFSNGKWPNHPDTTVAQVRLEIRRDGQTEVPERCCVLKWREGLIWKDGTIFYMQIWLLSLLLTTATTTTTTN